MIPELLLAGALTLAARGDEPPQADDRYRSTEVTALVTRGHDWLIEHQNKDGSFSIPRNSDAKAAPIAVTALAALSLMAAGHLPDRGHYERPVRRAIDWLVDHCSEDGYFQDDRDTISRMHGQGYAVLALTQACGMYGDDPVQRQRLRSAIERGVDLIQRTQGDRGGWWYDPMKVAAHENSVTVCMIQALRAARDVGFHVDSGVVDKAVAYVRDCQQVETGMFRYATNDEKTTWALTAAALSTLNALGDYGSPVWQRGFEALQHSDPFAGGGGGEAFQDYGALYAAQAYWQFQDSRAFDRWWPRFVADCAERQRPDGTFQEGTYGAVYGTAIVTLTLQVPLGYLPIFQR